jgi:hypothetical protein
LKLLIKLGDRRGLGKQVGTAHPVHKISETGLWGEISHYGAACSRVSCDKNANESLGK